MANAELIGKWCLVCEAAFTGEGGCCAQCRSQLPQVLTFNRGSPARDRRKSTHTVESMASLRRVHGGLGEEEECHDEVQLSA